MYINEFVAGIIVTLLAEAVILRGYAIYYTIKKNNGGKR